ncbi:hypothetical protein ACFL2Q_04360 [Thermodesulfobacteriota bacterium]
MVSGERDAHAGALYLRRNKNTKKGAHDMTNNGFREDELVTRRMNGQTKVFPVVGGRLRLAHEENEKLSLQTELVSWDGQYAVFRCIATTAKGSFAGYGTANAQRDTRLTESLIELAETRSCARALRFAGYGLEYCGAEEVSHVSETEPAPKPDGNGNGRYTPQHCGNGRATQAQCRALYALTKKAEYGKEDISNLLGPLDATTFQELTREAASQLISHLQTEVAA